MPFKYSCFISYRHGQRATADMLVDNLYQVLAGEIGFWLNEQVFLDRDRLSGGDFYNEALSNALCQSVCMIVLFTPVYFNRDFIYCAREYRAMEKLEEQRLRQLGQLSTREHGLIIPIVCRGRETLPRAITSKRQYFDFEKYYLCNRTLPQKGKCREEIQEIARYIYDRHEELKRLTEDPTTNCTTFKLPEEADVQRWLDSIGSQPVAAPFPGRPRVG